MKRGVACGVLAVAVVSIVAGVFVVRRIAVRDAENARGEMYRGYGIFADGSRLFVPLPPMLAHNGARAALGRQLFNDRRLACSQRLVCGACHWLGAGGTDSKTHHGILTRPAYNAVFATCYLHDGSMTNLRDVVRMMVETPQFCGGGSLAVVEAKIAPDASLVRRFQSAYESEGGFNGTNVVDSVVEYMKTLITSGTPYDFWCAGHENSIGLEQRRGSEVFLAARCIECHDGPALGGRRVSGGRKVPSLRGLSLRKSYFAKGVEGDLDVVVRRMPGGELTPEDGKAVKAFLQIL